MQKTDADYMNEDSATTALELIEISRISLSYNKKLKYGSIPKRSGGDTHMKIDKKT